MPRLGPFDFAQGRPTEAAVATRAVTILGGGESEEERGAVG